VRPSRVILIGFMGSGKTTVGRILADRLGLELVDTDALVEQRAGARVAEIFRARGESAFRSLESQALASLSDRQGLVIATGGGAPIQPANQAFFTTGEVFFLRVSLETARERARANPRGDRDRPLLALADADLGRLYERRQAVYESLGAAVQTDGRTPQQVSDEIVALLEARDSGEPG
jgi:shikimate kinase